MFARVFATEAFLTGSLGALAGMALGIAVGFAVTQGAVMSNMSGTVRGQSSSPCCFYLPVLLALILVVAQLWL